MSTALISTAFISIHGHSLHGAYALSFSRSARPAVSKCGLHLLPSVCHCSSQVPRNLEEVEMAIVGGKLGKKHTSTMKEGKCLFS